MFTPAAPGSPENGGKSVILALMSAVTIPPGWYETAPTVTISRSPSTDANICANQKRSAFERVLLYQAEAMMRRFVGMRMFRRNVNEFAGVLNSCGFVVIRGFPTLS